MIPEDFRKEKRETLAREIGPPCGGGTDSDVYPVLLRLNEFEFVYTIMSCSGVPGDPNHHGQYKMVGAGDYGIIKGGYQGWVLLNVDTSDSRFVDFKRGLENICGLELNERDEKFLREEGGHYGGPIRDMVLQVFVPDEIVEQTDSPYLANKWEEIHIFLTNLYTTLLISDSIKRKLKMDALVRKKEG